MSGVLTGSPESLSGKDYRTRAASAVPTCLLLGLAVALLLPWRANAAGQNPFRLDAPIIFTQVPLETRKDSGNGTSFAGARIVELAPDGTLRVLSESFDSACDPDISFDAQHILFAGKKSRSAPWRIWEMGVDGKEPRAISPDDLDARTPIYVSTLFTLESPEPWPTMVFVGSEKILGETGQPQVTSLYNLKLDGTELRRLTLNPNRNGDPLQMWDGRLVYSAQHFPHEPSSSPWRTSLYAIHLEGADMELFGGETGGRMQHMPCSLPLDRVVFVEPDLNAEDGAGRLAWLSERRPHAEYGLIRQDPKFRFLHPSPLIKGQVLVSRRPARKGGSSGVFWMNVNSGECRLIYDAPEYHDLQAKIVAPRTRPDGHSTVVDTKFSTGTFYCLNAYDTDPKLASHLVPGMIKRVRLVEGVPRGAGQDQASHLQPFVPRRLVGEAPVEQDGSFNVEVPADVPLLIQTLDDRGLALGNCGWVWVKPKETRGCIGCHEDPERTPENEYVLALRRPSTRLTLEPQQRRGLDFRGDIAPLLARNCASAECHGSSKNPLRLPLAEESNGEEVLLKSYAALLAPAVGRPIKAAGSPVSSAWPAAGKYVDPGRARTSPLVWQLAGTNTSRPWDILTDQKTASKINPGPAHSKLPPEDLRTIVQWVDMGAQYDSISTPATLAEMRPPQGNRK